ncbi:CoA pyrophosphatase [Altererythrobacter sp. RZ02]|uniref:CoA pyrophosphatase n=1 Tax=Pontixanthobacter rizhaonensis TaxID=2730337 RepID=A0A848QJC0_9SPHN|nr:CoA pyrophosphatase [Pontixanthobacter rizhaonensis]NMW30880.1 CoA pyrophosphatase [Pontixanthobacter rizhaonensis]
MSALFNKLSNLFEAGHRTGIGDLISEERYNANRRTKDAAVLIAVTDRAEPGIILTQRPQDMRDHPGQVAFPGGKLDPGEDAIAAALREANEELALDPATVRLIGTTDLYRTGTGFNVTPVLGVVPPDLALTPNPAEVDEWFEAPLNLVLDQSQWTRHAVEWRGTKREYLEMNWQGFRIWGVTAGIIYNLSQRIKFADVFGGIDHG